MTTFDVDAQQQISPYLESGERLIWSGRPGGGIRFRTHDLLLIPFGLVWVRNYSGQSVGNADAPGIRARSPVLHTVSGGRLPSYNRPLLH